jgi:hypothetical protein
MSLFRTFRLTLICVVLALSWTAVAHAQCSDCESIFEIDPAIALNGFAVLSGAIVLLFETYRSRP